MTDHISHQLRRITPNGKELEIGAGHKCLKDTVRRNPHSMSVPLKLVPQRNEGLYIATTTDHLYHNVQRQRPFLICVLGFWRGTKRTVCWRRF